MQQLAIKIGDMEVARWVRIKAAEQGKFISEIVYEILKKEMEREANENDTDNR
jgi:hypothetical protein